MSRKKVKVTVALAVLAMYAVCILLSYFSASGVVAKSFGEQSRNVYENINKCTFNKGETNPVNKEYSIYDADIFMMQELSQNYEFPLSAAIYDKNGKLVCTDTPYIWILADQKEKRKNYYGSLEDILTPDMKNKILNETKSEDQRSAIYYLDSIGFNIENDRVKPQYITFITPAQKKIDLTFSNEKSNYIYNKKDEKTLNSNGEESDDIKVQSAWVNNIITSKRHYWRNTKSNLTSELKDMQCSEQVNLISKTDKNLSDSGMLISGGKTMQIFEVLGDNEISLVLLSKRTPVLSVIDDYSFKSLAIISTLICLVFYFAARYLSLKIYDKNKRLEDSRKAFINAAAHELKTPLAVISNNCECIIENVSPEKNESYVNTIYTESKRMTKLTQMLINYNKVMQRGSIEKNKADLSSIVQKECEKYRAVFESKNMNVKLNTQPAIIKCNEDLIALAVDNFLSNAAKYGKENKDVVLTVTNDKNSVKFSIYNESDPIPDEALPHIWEELYRVDKSRNSKDNSTGMGLAINRQIFEIHKFKYDCRNVKNGVEFSFKA